MKIFHLHTRQELARPLDEVFEFFSRAENLEQITPPWLHFRITSERDREMHVGMKIDYRLKVRGIPVSWQSEITRWNAPHAFVDQQRRGPYRLWRHEHRFMARGSSTLVEDHVEYATLGDSIVNRVFLLPQLREIFEYRQVKIGELFGDVVAPEILFGENAAEMRFDTTPANATG
jgi:ligand-binding SRPBCC domain-containing protein